MMAPFPGFFLHHYNNENINVFIYVLGQAFIAALVAY